MGSAMVRLGTRVKWLAGGAPVPPPLEPVPPNHTNPMKYTGGFMLVPPLAPGSARGLLRTSPGRARG